MIAQSYDEEPVTYSGTCASTSSRRILPSFDCVIQFFCNSCYSAYLIEGRGSHHAPPYLGRFRSDHSTFFPLNFPPCANAGPTFLSLWRFMCGGSVCGSGRLMSYLWSGNVRELQNVVERDLNPNTLRHRMDNRAISALATACRNSLHNTSPPLPNVVSAASLCRSLA